MDVAKAQLEAQREEVGRLEKLVGFERIVAPFDGIITARNIDVGSLVTADVATATPLFSMARTDTLRVQVYVPQSAYFGLADGDRAKVTVPDLPGRSFEGRVTRSARVLSDSTRTILTEVDVDNQDGALTAGLYCTVHFEVHRTAPVVRIPSTAVIFSKNGLQAAIVRDNRIKLVSLEFEADDGAQVEVRLGLSQGDQVAFKSSSWRDRWDGGATPEGDRCLVGRQRCSPSAEKFRGKTPVGRSRRGIAPRSLFCTTAN